MQSRHHLTIVNGLQLRELTFADQMLLTHAPAEVAA